MTEMIYLNGSMVPHDEARISVFDHGFLYGYGLFETMRAYNGKIFLLERHIKRLLGSAEVIVLGDSLAGIDLAEACRATLEANKLKEARIRLTVTGGESDSHPWESEAGKPTVVITARQYIGFSDEKYEHGFKVFVGPIRRSARSAITGIKSTSYIISVMARNEAAARGTDEALLLNDDGYIAEGGSSNVFFVKSARLVTPSLASGILPGITRDLVMELADELGIVVTEGTVGLAVIKQCDEAFLTNTGMEIMPLTAANDSDGNEVVVGSGKPGEITRKLMATYKERVKKETGN